MHYNFLNMVGRRQIREKILQLIYSENVNKHTTSVAIDNFFTSIQKIYDLYVFQLNFFLIKRKTLKLQTILIQI